MDREVAEKYKVSKLDAGELAAFNIARCSLAAQALERKADNQKE